jgi:hypothetical protein
MGWGNCIIRKVVRKGGIVSVLEGELNLKASPSSSSAPAWLVLVS